MEFEAMGLIAEGQLVLIQSAPVSELDDLQLALVGGGIGDCVAG